MICASSFYAANAQVSFGAKAGLNVATLTGDVEGAKSKVGFNIGAIAEISLSESFAFQPELVFSTQGAKFEEDGESATLKNNFLNVPLLAKYKTSSGFYAVTGPQIGFLMSAKAEVMDIEVDAKDAYKKTDFSWAFGAGYMVTPNIGIDARYNLGLSNNSEDEEGKIKNSVFQVGLVYKFGK
jgi:opacity protein-like surface antigen